MKVTIWGINYAPEPTGIGPYNTDLAAYFHERGHDVRVVTGFPYYPRWRKSPGDRGRLFRVEERQGIRIHRCWQFVPARPNAWKRILHEASFIFCSFCRLLFTPRPDLLIVISPPLLLGPAAWLAGVIKRCPFHFHIQDMQPDAALSLGLLKPGLLTDILYRVERFTCKRAQTVSGITRGMLEMLTQKGIPASRQYLLPNWILPSSSKGSELRDGAFREEHDLSKHAFLVVYSGNIGKKQGLGILLDAAERIGRSPTNREIAFVLAGEGAAKEHLRRRIESERVPVQLLPLQPEPLFQAMLREADLCVVTQQPGSGALFFPSKLITLLSAGCPVVTVADEDSEVARAVKEGAFGRNVSPGDSAGLANLIASLEQDPDQLVAMAEAGRAWVKQFSRHTVLGDFAERLDADLNRKEAASKSQLVNETE